MTEKKEKKAEETKPEPVTEFKIGRGGKQLRLPFHSEKSPSQFTIRAGRSAESEGRRRCARYKASVTSLFFRGDIMVEEIWWKGLETRTIQKCYYRCSCPRCKVPFIVPEDLPEREENFFGAVDVFVVYCPVCGQKLRFSIDDTPAKMT